jgi:hypothetical protein
MRRAPVFVMATLMRIAPTGAGVMCRPPGSTGAVFWGSWSAWAVYPTRVGHWRPLHREGDGHQRGDRPRAGVMTDAPPQPGRSGHDRRRTPTMRR